MIRKIFWQYHLHYSVIRCHVTREKNVLWCEVYIFIILIENLYPLNNNSPSFFLLALGNLYSFCLWICLFWIPHVSGVKGTCSGKNEAMNSEHLSMCQKDVRPCVQKRWRTMASSRVSTGDSVIPSSCEMKYEPEFKPLQGNPAFFCNDQITKYYKLYYKNATKKQMTKIYFNIWIYVICEICTTM